MLNQTITFNEYQDFCQGVRLPTATPEYCLLNLPGEVGELCSLLAKAIRDGEKEDHKVNVRKELGDALWSIATIAHDHGFTLEDIVIGNVTKLSRRKEAGTFQGSGDNR